MNPSTDNAPVERAALEKFVPGPGNGKQIVMWLYLFVLLGLTSVAVWAAVAVFRLLLPLETAWDYAEAILAATLVFHFAYLAALLGLRLIIPYCPEGFYPITADGRLPKEIVIFMFNILLTKARYEPPWMHFLGGMLANIHPLRLPYRRYFGPHTVSDNFGDLTRFLDPYLVHAGRNVQFGFFTVVICHLFDNRGLRIERVVIEDHATIGGESLLMPGVRIGHHALVAARSLVKAGTQIGPYEYWGGIPAKFIKKLEPAEAAAAEPAA